MATISGRYTGWHYDAGNARLDFYYRGTRVGSYDASGIDTTDSAITNNIAAVSGIATAARIQIANLGSVGAVASNGGGAIVADIGFVAPASISVLSAWAVNISASDVTTGTATSSASYRRVNLVANVTGTGSGTTIVASLNATASAASNVTRAFAVTANNTMPAGALMLCSHLTVGANTADGTDMAARLFQIAYCLA